MKRMMIFLLAVMCVSALLVSCKADAVEEMLPQGVVGVSMSVDMPKAITMSVEDEVKQYEYRALPQFDIGEETYNDGIFGEQYTWREVAVSGYKASLGYYRQGLWVFEVRCKNKRDQVLMTGVSEPTYLQKGKTNLVRITLKQDDGEGRSGQNWNTGKIVFGFESNMLDETEYNIDHAYIRIEADKFDVNGNIDTRTGYYNLRMEEDNDRGLTLVNHGFTSLLPGETDSSGLLADMYGTTVAQARARYYGETPDLVDRTKEVTYIGEGEQTVTETIHYWADGVEAGNYILRIKQCVIDEDTGDEIVIAGQALAIKVIGGETTTVIGTLVPERYINTTLLLTVAENVDGDIASNGAFQIRTDNLNTSALTVRYVPDDPNLGTDLEYRWYVDGVLQSGETSDSFVFHPQRYGDAKITCYVNGHVGPNTYFGKQASATQVVQVKPATGANVTAYATDPSF